MRTRTPLLLVLFLFTGCDFSFPLFECIEDPTCRVGTLAFFNNSARPRSGRAGGPIDPAIQVVLRDAQGAPAFQATDRVTIRLSGHPSGAVLSGTTSVAAVNGFATFLNLSIDRPGEGFTLIAEAGTRFQAATSAPFNVTPAGGP